MNSEENLQYKQIWKDINSHTSSAPLPLSDKGIDQRFNFSMSESIEFTTYYEIPFQECSVLILRKHFFELNSLKFYSFVRVLPSVVKLISYNPFFPYGSTFVT